MFPYFLGNYPNYSFMPFIPIQNMEPPKLYDLMNSYVNYNLKDEYGGKVPPYKLAEYFRKEAFPTADYPLSNYVSRETFEKNILNHFILRRIGFQTFTTWQMMMYNKLNEIMPRYNKMFDALENWDIFNDGTTVTINSTDNRNVENSKTGNTANSEISETSENITNNQDVTSSSTRNQIQDMRNSDMPQNELQNIRDGSYLTDYNYNTQDNKDSNSGNTQGTSTRVNKFNTQGNSNSNETNKTADDNVHQETRKRSPEDKIYIMKEMQNNIQNIYTMIYNDLEPLFYQVIY